MHTVIFLLISSIFILFSPSLNAMDLPKPKKLQKKHSRSKSTEKSRQKSKEETSQKRITYSPIVPSASLTSLETIQQDSQSPEIPLTPIVTSTDRETKVDASPPVSPKKRSRKSKISSSDVSSHDTSFRKSFPANKDKEELKQPPTPLIPNISLINLETKHSQSPATSPKKMSQRSTISSSDPASPHNKILKKIKRNDNYLRKAIERGDKKARKVIQTFFENTSDPNQQSIYNRNTLLHYAVFNFYRHHNLKLINLFVQNPHVNTLIKNEDKCAPYQCFDPIQQEKYPELYRILILRATLDHIVNALLITDPEIIATCFDENNDLIDNTTLMKKLVIIIQRTSKILPPYAIAVFVRDMIHSRLKHNRLTIKELLRKYNKIPNYQDPESGDTLVHALVILRDEDRLKTLLDDPNVISIIKNSENLLPSQLIDSSEKRLRSMLFERASIDTYLQRTVFSLNQEKITHLEATDKSFKSIMTKTQEFFDGVKFAQSEADRALPETSLPKYANDATFLLQHCNFLLKQYKSENITEPNFKEYFTHIAKEKDDEYQTAIFSLRMRAALYNLMASSESTSETSKKPASKSTVIERKSLISPGSRSVSDDMLYEFGLH